MSETPRSFSMPWEKAGWEFLPERAVWWGQESILIVSDLHLGKAAHFRKNGIAIPNSVNENTLKRLDELLQARKPKRLLILGDLFHSEVNEEWQEFRKWLNGVNNNSWFKESLLILGNHDVLPVSAYEGLPLSVHQTSVIGEFVFAHDPADLEALPIDKIGVAGHLHPAIVMKGKGRQSLKLPGWWFNSVKRFLVFPAFGTFTGSVAVTPVSGDHCWVTTGRESIKLDLD
ncbi:MAG: ligase-associated DNA damage response endonuclease PdeM [Bacteroidetes bacterium]|nr:ligase-associated DNA damage response endonuclease PdeM [Bacteroidota bacterium]MDA1335774.1 ligase-associated DNA damage response endonuclease PdeM [Bacteroidota bacterium]